MFSIENKEFSNQIKLTNVHRNVSLGISNFNEPQKRARIGKETFTRKMWLVTE